MSNLFYFYYVTGDSSTLTESKNVFVERNIKYARANLQIGDIQFSAVSKLDFANKWDYKTNFLATDVDVGKPIVDLVDDATSWHTGIMML